MIGVSDQSHELNMIESVTPSYGGGLDDNAKDARFNKSMTNKWLTWFTIIPIYHMVS